jgi:hypothetical protein
MRKVCLMLCILALVGALSGCFGSRSIVGTWKHDSLGAAYEFTEDQQIIITLSGQNPVYGSYTLDKDTNTLVLSVNGQQQSGIIEVTSKQLRITSPDSGAVITMTRVR